MFRVYFDSRLVEFPTASSGSSVFKSRLHWRARCNNNTKPTTNGGILDDDDRIPVIYNQIFISVKRSFLDEKFDTIISFYFDYLTL